MQYPTNQLHKRMICLICISLAVCLILGIGITYARYQWEFPRKSYVFSPSAPEQLVLCGGQVNQSWIDGGNLPALPQNWEQTQEGYKLDFAVTNGQIGDFAQRDQQYEIRLAAGLPIADPQNLTVTLSWQDAAGQTHIAQGSAVPIEKGSFLYDSFGEGWIYRFFSGEEELHFTLAGGALNYRNYTVTVSGMTEQVLLDLQITGSYIR